MCQDESEHPEAGSVSVCIECRQVSVFTPELQLRKPTDEEQLELASDERITELRIVMAGAPRSVPDASKTTL